MKGMLIPMESKLTTRAQEAVTAAQRLAVSGGHPALESVHLLQALLEQTDGIAVPLLQAAGADPAQVGKEATSAVGRLPSASGSTVSAPAPSRDLLRVLNAAGEQATRWATSTSPPSTCWSGLPRSAVRRPRCWLTPGPPPTH